MRFALLLVLVVGCDPPKRDPGAADAPPVVVECDGGVDCEAARCMAQGKPPTTISGTVFAPNGTLPLYGVTVYVPEEDPGPLAQGAVCARCEKDLPGHAIVRGETDSSGTFTLAVQAASNVPVVVQIGKWRRRFEIPEVVACQDNPIAAEQTRLPKNHTEGDMPKIAIVTGQFDALECLVRKLGVEDAEFSSSLMPGQVHLYASNGATTTVNDTNSFLPATTLWSDLDRMKQYDLALFSCEGEQLAVQKTQAMMDLLKEYADFGGRVFLSHYHHIWIAGERGNPNHAPAVWKDIATCQDQFASTGYAFIDQNGSPKGPAFAEWMAKVQGSIGSGAIPVVDGRESCSSLDLTKAERWVVTQRNAISLPQIFQFTTPNEVATEDRCGKVVFSDMHVSSNSTSSAGTPFPQGCSNAPLTPQEKALAFMFFDIATCLEVF